MVMMGIDLVGSEKERERERGCVGHAGSDDNETKCVNFSVV